MYSTNNLFFLVLMRNKLEMDELRATGRLGSPPGPSSNVEPGESSLGTEVFEDEELASGHLGEEVSGKKKKGKVGEEKKKEILSKKRTKKQVTSKTSKKKSSGEQSSSEESSGEQSSGDESSGEESSEEVESSDTGL